MTLEEAEAFMTATVRDLQRRGFTFPPVIWVYDNKTKKSARINTNTCRDGIDRRETP